MAENDWVQWSKHVLIEMERARTNIAELDKKLDQHILNTAEKIARMEEQLKQMLNSKKKNGNGSKMSERTLLTIGENTGEGRMNNKIVFWLMSLILGSGCISAIGLFVKFVVLPYLRK